MTARPDPVGLRVAAVLADHAVAMLHRAAGQAATAGIVVDSEVAQCTAVVASWAAWLGEQADAAEPGSGRSSGATRSRPRRPPTARRPGGKPWRIEHGIAVLRLEDQ